MEHQKYLSQKGTCIEQLTQIIYFGRESKEHFFSFGSSLWIQLHLVNAAIILSLKIEK